MSNSNHIEELLYNAFDHASVEEMYYILENADLNELACPSTDRITKTALQKCFGTDPVKSQVSFFKPRIAVAVAILVVVSAFLIIGGEQVYAALEKLFSFIPGVGVVEIEGEPTAEDEQPASGTDAQHYNVPAYIMQEQMPCAQDDLLKIEISSVTLSDGILEISYSLNLIGLSDDDVIGIYDHGSISPVELYLREGYDAYFAVDNYREVQSEDFLRPYSSVTLGDTVLERLEAEISIPERNGLREAGCRERYAVVGEPDLSGFLTVGCLDVPFSLVTPEVFYSQMEAAANGEICTVNDVTVMCVPTWTDDSLFIDLYTINSGKYTELTHFSTGVEGFSYIIANDTQVKGLIDGGYISPDDSNYSGLIGRARFETENVPGEINLARLTIPGISAREENSLLLEFDHPIGDTETIDRREQLIDTAITFVSVEKLTPKQASMDDYHSGDVLSLKIRPDTNSTFSRFHRFGKISVNGQELERYSQTEDTEFLIFNLPLSCKYEEVETIEFTDFIYVLTGNFKFDLIPEGCEEQAAAELAAQEQYSVEARLRMKEVWEHLPYVNDYIPMCFHGDFVNGICGGDRITRVTFTNIVFDEVYEYIDTLKGEIVEELIASPNDFYVSGRVKADGATVFWEISYSQGSMELAVHPPR